MSSLEHLPYTGKSPDQEASSSSKRDWLGLNRLPTLQRTAAVSMILFQNLALKLLMEPAPMAVGILGLAGWFAPQFRLLVWLPIPMTLLSIVTFFVLRCRTVDSDFSSMGFIGTDIAYHMSCCCLAIQLAMLFMRQYEKRLPIWLLGVSGAGMVLSGDIRIAGGHREQMMIITAFYLICWIVFAASCRVRIPVMKLRGGWIRATVLVLTVLASLAAGRGVAIAFHRHENQLERLIGALLFSREQYQTRHGFSGGGGLNDVMNMRHASGNEVALQVSSEERPDYLRGKVFDYFFRNRWHLTGDEGGVATQDVSWNGDLSVELSRRFILNSKRPVVTSFHIRPAGRKVSSFCFLPLNTVAVQCNSNVLRVNQSGIVERLDCDGGQNYVAEVGLPERYSFDQIDPKYLQLPSQIGPVTQSLAKALAEGKQTTSEKIDAITSFFQDEFQYELGIEMPRHFDRIEYFLANRVAAHCEYFATATVILLRLQGIPARYVTGFVVNDRNTYVGEWVVRNRDAHAWVEAYDEEQQEWVTVESTPASGIPSKYPTTHWEEFREAAYFYARQFGELISSPEFWETVVKNAKSLASGLLWVGIALGVLLGLQRIYFPDIILIRKSIPLARERIQMDRYLSRRGLARGKSETVLSFAKRLEQSRWLSTAEDLANWYRDYASLRFDEQLGKNENYLMQLQTRRRELMSQTKVISEAMT